MKKTDFAIRLIIRIIASPFLLSLMAVGSALNLVKIGIMFVRYGGEWFQYEREDKILVKQLIIELREFINEENKDNE
jgi:hypothetical protein